MLQVKDLHASYGRVAAVHGVSFAVRRGEIVTLIGPNGAGKTSILMSIMGFLKGTRGEIRFEGEDLRRQATEAIVERGLAMVPEDRGLFPPLSVLENLTLGSYLRLKKSNPVLPNKALIAADLEQVFTLFPILKTRLAQPVGTLSGGQQQMVAIGRALMAKPRLLILDEPSLGLAPLVIREIFRVVRSLNQNGVTVLLIEQNANLALKTAHRGYVLENGRICLEGTAAELLANQEMKRAYLGGNYD